MGINRAPVYAALRSLLGRGLTQAEVTRMEAALDEAEGLAVRVTALANDTVFFQSVRDAFGSFKQGQVGGFIRLLGAFGAARWPIAWAAYGLATAWHETAMTMQPVREAFWKSEEWRKANLRYYPWYGRGDVQLTWKPNYERADEELALNGALIADPDLAMRPDISARVLVHGMEAGWFTAKRLGDFLPLAGQAGFDAYKQARRIINGQDKAEQIAKEALVFEAALDAGGWA